MFAKPLLFVVVALGCAPSFANCLVMGDSHSGGISTESSTFINQCNITVSYTYCVESRQDGPFSCRQQKFGSGGVAPGGRDAFSIMGAEGAPFRVYWAECEATPQNRHPMAVNGRFEGNRVVAKCG